MTTAADFGLFVTVLLWIALGVLGAFLCHLRGQSKVLGLCVGLLFGFTFAAFPYYTGFQSAREGHQAARNFEVRTYHVIVQWNWRLSPEEFLEKIRAFSDEQPAEMMIIGIRNVSPNRSRGVIEVNTQLSGRELVRMLMVQDIVEKAEVDQQWRGD